MVSELKTSLISSGMFGLCGLDVIDLGTATSNPGMVER
jgi:hypothetical protein